MRQVLEQYVQAVIAVIVAIVMSIVLCRISIGESHGVASLFGKVLEREISDKKVVYENTEFKVFHKAYTPVITIKDYYVMQVGKWMRPDDCFFARTEDEKQSAVTIEGVWKLDGAEVELDVVDDGSFRFEESGIYWLSLSASDERGYGRSVFVKLFVNGGIDG